MIRLDERTGVIAGYAATPIDHEGRNRSANRAEEQRRGAIGVAVHGRRVGKAQQADVWLSQHEYRRSKQD